MLNQTSVSQQQLFNAAKSYLAEGLSIIPMREKVPALAWTQYQTRPPTEEEVATWWGEDARERFNLGIVTGKIRDSGLVVIDADSAEDALFWEKEFPATPAVVLTGGGRGGKHFYYRYPEGIEHIGNRIGAVDRKIDIRADAGVALAPPSVTKGPYLWQVRGTELVPDVLPAFDPTWIPKQAPLITPSIPLNVDESLEPSERVLRARHYIAKIHAIEGEGGDRTTFRVACKLRDFGLCFEEALAEIVRWNESGNAEPPWDLSALRHKVEVAFSKLP